MRLTWSRAIGEFGATVTLAGAASKKTETLPSSIYLSFAQADIEKAVMIISILIFISVVLLMFIRKFDSGRLKIS